MVPWTMPSGTSEKGHIQSGWIRRWVTHALIGISVIEPYVQGYKKTTGL